MSWVAKVWPRKLKAVIFDMDNTLFEFVDAQVKACKAVVDRIGKGNKIDLLDQFLSQIRESGLPAGLHSRSRKDNQR